MELQDSLELGWMIVLSWELGQDAIDGLRIVQVCLRSISVVIFGLGFKTGNRVYTRSF